MNDELIALLRAIRPKYSDVGSRDVDTTASQKKIDHAIELLSASKPAALDQGYVTALVKRMQDYCDSLAPPIARGLMAEAVRAMLAASPAAPAQRPTDDTLWDQTLQERDTYHDWADKLADAISLHLGVDVGEHTSLNNPWNEALDAIMSAPSLAELSAASAQSPALVGWWDSAEPSGFRWKEGIVRGDFVDGTPIYAHAPAAPAKSGEPVAWLCEWPGDDGQTWVYAHANELSAIDQQKRRPDTTITPLYAAPQPSQPVQAGESPPVDADLRGTTVVLHFESAEATERFHTRTIQNVAIVQNIGVLASPKSAIVPDAERTAFEAWWKTLPGESNPQERDDSYEADVKGWAFMAWQARAASPQATATQPASGGES